MAAERRDRDRGGTAARAASPRRPPPGPAAPSRGAAPGVPARAVAPRPTTGPTRSQTRRGRSRRRADAAVDLWSAGGVRLEAGAADRRARRRPRRSGSSPSRPAAATTRPVAAPVGGRRSCSAPRPATWRRDRTSARFDGAAGRRTVCPRLRRRRRAEPRGGRIDRTPGPRRRARRRRRRPTRAVHTGWSRPRTPTLFRGLVRRWWLPDRRRPVPRARRRPVDPGRHPGCGRPARRHVRASAPPEVTPRRPDPSPTPPLCGGTVRRGRPAVVHRRHRRARDRHGRAVRGGSDAASTRRTSRATAAAGPRDHHP